MERQQLGGGLGGGLGWNKVVPNASEGVVAVVGVGPGLGAAIARRFARERYIVAILARDLGSNSCKQSRKVGHCFHSAKSCFGISLYCSMLGVYDFFLSISFSIVAILRTGFEL